MCDAGYQGVEDIYLIDLHASSSSTRKIGGSSSVISHGSPILNFVPPELCTPYPDQCLSYCTNTCLRTVTYAVDPAETARFKLRVCKTDDPGRCAETEEAYWYRDQGDEFETLMYNTRAERQRYFTTTLPKGSYRAEFLDTGGNVVWPSHVIETYEEALCSDALEEGSITVVVPEVRDGECDDLIRNGNAEASTLNHTYWLHRRGGIVLSPGQGIGGSNAFATIEDDSTRFDSVAQYLDTRCLTLNVGKQYEINAWVKLTNGSGEVKICDPEEDDCPQVGLYGQADDGTFWDDQPFATVVPFVRNGDFQLVQGLLDVTEEIASSSSVLFYLRRNTRRLTMYVDNVSMRNPEATGGMPENPVGSGGSDGFGGYRPGDSDTGGGASDNGGFGSDIGGDSNDGNDNDGNSNGGVVNNDGNNNGAVVSNDENDNDGNNNGGVVNDNSSGTGCEESNNNGGGSMSGGTSGGWGRPGSTMGGIFDGMCGNMVSNGDFSVGDTRWWKDTEDQELTLISPGYRGVSDLALSSLEGRMEQELQNTDFRLGMNYIVSGRFRLLDEIGHPVACAKETCPKMVLKLTDLAEESMQTVAQVLGEPRSANWAILLGGFSGDETHVGADSIKVQFVSTERFCPK